MSIIFIVCTLLIAAFLIAGSAMFLFVQFNEEKKSKELDPESLKEFSNQPNQNTIE